MVSPFYRNFHCPRCASNDGGCSRRVTQMCWDSSSYMSYHMTIPYRTRKLRPLKGLTPRIHVLLVFLILTRSEFPRQLILSNHICWMAADSRLVLTQEDLLNLVELHQANDTVKAYGVVLWFRSFLCKTHSGNAFFEERFGNT